MNLHHEEEGCCHPHALDVFSVDLGTMRPVEIPGYDLRIDLLLTKELQHSCLLVSRMSGKICVRNLHRDGELPHELRVVEILICRLAFVHSVKRRPSGFGPCVKVVPSRRCFDGCAFFTETLKGSV